MTFDFNLQRTDFAQVGQTNQGCMRVVPVDKAELRKKGRGLDKVVIGSQNGCVICINRKHNDTQIVYKTLPGSPIEAVCLGGALGSIQDKVFVAIENSVRGISKKGKQFFNFDTNMAEPIRKMYIYGVDLVLCGIKSYNHYHDCVDTNHVLCNEEILDVVVLSSNQAWAARGFSSVVACGDSTIKVIENSKIDYELQLSDVPCTLQLYFGEENERVNRHMVLFGTKNGKLGLINVPEKRGSVLWETASTTASMITTITCYKFTGNNIPDIIIGKEDGLIEIYSVDDNDQPHFVYCYQSDESITSIGCGRISNEEVDEIMVCTYTGWLFSLSRVNLSVAAAVPNAKGKLPPTQPINVKVQQLKNELEELESKVNEERTRYEELTSKKDGTATAIVPHFQIHDNFLYHNTYGCYVLSLELVIPIDYLVIQSEIKVELLEAEKNTAVFSLTEYTDDDVSEILATYRCQANTTRIELRIRTDEGSNGLIHVYLCPKIHPKMCQMRTYEVKPLATHSRVHSFDIARPTNTLSFTGTFSLAEAHAWLLQCLPSLPLKAPPQDTITFNFQSVVHCGTQLQLNYARNSIVFKSDTMTSIAIMRDKISDILHKRQIKATIHCDLNENSVAACLTMFHPRMSQLHALERRKKLALALMELKSNNDDVSWMNDEYKIILQEHNTVLEQAQNEPLADNALLIAYEDLLVSRAKLNGYNAKHKVPALRELLLTNYSLENVKKFFEDTHSGV